MRILRGKRKALLTLRNTVTPQSLLEATNHLLSKNQSRASTKEKVERSKRSTIWFLENLVSDKHLLWQFQHDVEAAWISGLCMDPKIHLDKNAPWSSGYGCLKA